MNAVGSTLNAAVSVPHVAAELSTAPPRTFRIAMVAACPLPARRGTPLRIERLAEALYARGHHVEVITYHVTDDQKSLGFPVHRIFGKRRYRPMSAGPNLRKLCLYDPALACKLWSFLARGKFDLVHAHHIEGLLVTLPSRLRHSIPLIFDAHTMLTSELPSYCPAFSRGPMARVGYWLDGLLSRSADHVVAVTGDIRRHLIERHGMPSQRISVVTNGVESERFKVADGPRRDGFIRIIYTGTLAPYQDIELLLEAFARALLARRDLRLCLSLSSSFYDYEAYASRLGVRSSIDLLPGRFDLVPRHLAACAIAALPRTCCDGIPQKLLNYMAAGKAIVASAGSAKLLDDGRTGLVVPNGDVEGFAAALLRLADSPELVSALGGAARTVVESDYSWEQAAQRLERVYARLVRG